MNSTDRRTFMTHAAGAAAAMAILPELRGAVPRTGREAFPVAVIGVGRQGRAIVGELQKIEAATIAAVCDVDPGRLTAATKRAAGAEGFATHQELLDKRKDIKAVFIATPTHLHRQIVEDCLAAGKHVFCETPLSNTIDEAKLIAKAAKGASTVFFAGLQARSNPVYSLARSFFRSDAVRELVSMRAHHHQKTTWRTPTSDPSRDKAMNWQLDPELSIGLAGEFGTQQFDVFHYFTSKTPISVMGTGGVRLHSDGRQIADTVAAMLGFPGGANLYYEASLANSFEGRYEILHGSNATIKLAWTHGWMFKEADAPTQGWEVYANRQQFFNDEGITLIADATKLASQGKLKDGIGLPFPALYYSIGDFLKCAIDGKQVSATAEDGVRATAVGILANQAIVTGKPVMIDDSIFKGA